jgi:hypothetical protein
VSLGTIIDMSQECVLVLRVPVCFKLRVRAYDPLPVLYMVYPQPRHP